MTKQQIQEKIQTRRTVSECWRKGENVFRKAVRSDIKKIKELTSICFDGVSIDQSIEKLFGMIGELDWKQRKVCHIDNDWEADGELFVAEVDEQVVGYITTRIDRYTKIGWIPNLAVLPEYQKRGIGRQLIEKALDYFRSEGMLLAKIETLERNEVGKYFYPKMSFKEVARQIHYVKKIG